VTFSFIQIAWNYLIYFHPMEDNFTNAMEIFAEITNLVLMYHVLLFTDFVPDVTIRYMIGYSFIGCMAIFISVHLFLMFRDTLLKFRDRQRKKSKKKRDNQAKLRARERKMMTFKQKIARILQKRGQPGRHNEVLAGFARFIAVEDIEELELDEYEALMDRITKSQQDEDARNSRLKEGKQREKSASKLLRGRETPISSEHEGAENNQSKFQKKITMKSSKTVTSRESSPDQETTIMI